MVRVEFPGRRLFEWSGYDRMGESVTAGGTQERHGKCVEIASGDWSTTAISHEGGTDVVRDT